MLFEVTRKDEDNDGPWSWLSAHVKVYDIRYNANGYPQFLIYEDNQWKLVSAKHFRPKRNSLYGIE